MSAKDRNPQRADHSVAHAGSWPRAPLQQLDELQAEVERLRQLALTDPLTGLPNRRAWDAELKREMSRSRRSERPFCVALIDLDRFKDYNDSHGHPAADRLLIEAVDAWVEQIRDVDLLCRWGGDEFALLLPDCDAEDAGEVLARLEAAAPRAQTCSYGIARWERFETAERLVDRADRLLYRCKRRKSRGGIGLGRRFRGGAAGGESR